MKQNYVRRLLNRPHPQMLRYEDQRRSQPAFEMGRRIGGGGKTAPATETLSRLSAKTILFGLRYNSLLPKTASQRVFLEMSTEELEKRTIHFWSGILRRGVFDTKELHDNGFGGGL